VTSVPPALAPPPRSLTERDRGARVYTAFRLLALAAGLTVPALREGGATFVTSTDWVPNDVDGPGPATPKFGALAFVYGTAVVSTVAVVLAVPVSAGIALFVTEVAGRRVGRLVVTLLDLLAAVPSVVFGLWGIAVLAPNVGGLYGRIHDLLGPIPVLGSIFGPPDASGRTFMTAGIILAVMIVPIVSSIMREVLTTVPNADRDGALALGATRWEMIRGVVFPHSFSGMVGAVMLGLGRAMGETIAVALTIGASLQVTANLFAPGDAMPAVIVNQFGESSGTFRSALIALGVVLFAITILVNVAARWIVTKADLRMRGAL
jgi:phosphate transport system permease protein